MSFVLHNYYENSEHKYELYYVKNIDEVLEKCHQNIVGDYIYFTKDQAWLISYNNENKYKNRFNVIKLGEYKDARLNIVVQLNSFRLDVVFNDDFYFTLCGNCSKNHVLKFKSLLEDFFKQPSAKTKTRYIKEIY